MANPVIPGYGLSASVPDHYPAWPPCDVLFIPNTDVGFAVVLATAIQASVCISLLLGGFDVGLIISSRQRYELTSFVPMRSLHIGLCEHFNQTVRPARWPSEQSLGRLPVLG